MSELALTFLDVQHGSACHIETPSGKHFMFDLGTGDFDKSQDGDNHSPLLYLKNSRGVSRLDGVIITHPHTDHIDDIFNFHSLKPAALWRPKHLTPESIRSGNRTSDNAKIEKYLQISAEYNQPVLITENPSETTNNGCDQFEIFGVTTPAQSNLNNHSMAAVVSFAGSKILLTGDQESAAWDELLQNRAFVSAVVGTDILLASHHGRESGFCEKLFEKTGKPCLTIVSDTNAGETCVRQKYYEKSSGWLVSSRSNMSKETRYCLTTRNDGTIQVKCGPNENGTRYRSVTIR